MMLDYETTNRELARVTRRAKYLLDKHQALYPRVKQVINAFNDTQFEEHLFRAGEYELVDRFSTLMYFYYLNHTYNPSDTIWKHISDALTENNYILFVQTTGGPPRPNEERLVSVNEGIRWLIAYRMTREYFLRKLRDETNKKVQICNV